MLDRSFQGQRSRAAGRAQWRLSEFRFSHGAVPFAILAFLVFGCAEMPVGGTSETKPKTSSTTTKAAQGGAGS